MIPIRMVPRTLGRLAAASLLAMGATMSAMAQDGPAPRGEGRPEARADQGKDARRGERADRKAARREDRKGERPGRAEVARRGPGRPAAEIGRGRQPAGRVGGPGLRGRMAAPGLRPAGRPAGPGVAGARPMGAPPIWAALDKDRDGVLSAHEIQAAPGALKQLDANGDGQVTPRELLRAVVGGGRGPDAAGRTPAARPGREGRPERPESARDGDRPARGDRPERDRPRDGERGPRRPGGGSPSRDGERADGPTEA